MHHLTERLGTRDKAGTEHKKVALLHFCTPLRVRVRATVKLSSAAFFHDESSITKGGGGGDKSAIAPKKLCHFQMAKLITNR